MMARHGSAWAAKINGNAYRDYLTKHPKAQKILLTRPQMEAIIRDLCEYSDLHADMEQGAKVIIALAAYRDADRDYFASGISDEERSRRARRCSDARHAMFSALWHYEDSALQSPKLLVKVSEK